jgi:hypothetical protein
MMSDQFRRVDNPEKHIRRLLLRQAHSTHPDIDYLLTQYDEATQTIIESSRYGNETVAEYGWAKVKQWIDEDHCRWEAHGETWHDLFLWAEADIVVGGVIQTIRSGGLGGVESDSGADFICQAMRDELAELKGILVNLGFDADTVSSTPFGGLKSAWDCITTIHRTLGEFIAGTNKEAT